MLGAIGEGDIGDHFPPTDPQWKGASSDQFLTHAVDLVRRRGGRMVNVDVTLICERPKIGPHREAMRERIADLLGLPLDRVSVKATTTEGMGFTGRERRPDRRPGRHSIHIVHRGRDRRPRGAMSSPTMARCRRWWPG
jgi:2-C-methyl-D-erythritol 2,4-cyclodiphosphate synthase